MWPHGVAVGKAAAALMISRGSAFGQHDLRADFRQRSLGRCNEPIAVGTGRNHRDTGIGTELASAHGERSRPVLADRYAACRERLRWQKHRVDRPKFAKERDRLGALRAQIEQGATAIERTGEADRLDEGMPNKTFIARHVWIAASL